MATRGEYIGIIGYDIYDPGNGFWANRGVGAMVPTPDHKGADYGTHGAIGVGTIGDRPRFPDLC